MTPLIKQKKTIDFFNNGLLDDLSPLDNNGWSISSVSSSKIQLRDGSGNSASAVGSFSSFPAHIYSGTITRSSGLQVSFNANLSIDSYYSVSGYITNIALSKGNYGAEINGTYNLNGFVSNVTSLKLSYGTYSIILKGIFTAGDTSVDGSLTGIEVYSGQKQATISDINVSLSDFSYADATVSYIESLLLNDDNISGGESTNDILYGYGGADLINALGGADILYGGDSTDTLQGGAGNDIYIMNDTSEHTAAEITDSAGVDEIRFSSTVEGQTFRLYGGDVGIDKIIIGTGTSSTAVTTGTTNLNVMASYGVNALTIIGNNGNNYLTGTLYNDNIQGGAGNDTLEGLGGTNTLVGGLGNDIYYVSSAYDVITESSNAGIDTVYSYSNTYTLSANVENLTLQNISSYTTTGIGNSTANTVTGNNYDNTLNGGAGNDTLIGGLGADHFVFNTTLNATTNVDTITDFVTGTDKIDLTKTALMANLVSSGSTLNSSDFLVSSLHSNTASQHLLFNTTTNGLYYNADGSGTGAAILFATLTGISHADHIHASDFVII